MNEEEKQAIDWLKEELDDEKKSYKNCNYSYKGVTGLYGNNEVEIALKLIEKQQKEIERLKNLNKNTYIRKDTIRDIIFEFIPKSTHEVELRTKIIKLLGE